MNFLSILMNNSTTAAQLAEVETGFFTGILTFLLLPWVSYIVITIFFIALIIFHERGQIGWSHTVFIIIVAYLLFKFNITDFKSIINNPLPILKWVIIYLIVGMAWSFLKWYLYLRNTLEEFNNTKEQIASSIKQTSNEKYDKEIFKRKLFSVFQYEKNGIKIEQSAIIETINVVLSEGMDGERRHRHMDARELRAGHGHVLRLFRAGNERHAACELHGRGGAGGLWQKRGRCDPAERR
jgi:hypothetical protein